MPSNFNQQNILCWNIGQLLRWMVCPDRKYLKVVLELSTLDYIFSQISLYCHEVYNPLNVSLIDASWKSSSIKKLRASPVSLYGDLLPPSVICFDTAMTVCRGRSGWWEPTQAAARSLLNQISPLGKPSPSPSLPPPSLPLSASPHWIESIFSPLSTSQWFFMNKLWFVSNNAVTVSSRGEIWVVRTNTGSCPLSCRSSLPSQPALSLPPSLSRSEGLQWGETKRILYLVPFVSLLDNFELFKLLVYESKVTVESVKIR